jgi:hypothetical protein
VGNVDDVDGLAGILGCGVSSLPFNYIGLPLRVGGGFQVILDLRWHDLWCGDMTLKEAF